MTTFCTVTYTTAAQAPSQTRVPDGCRRHELRLTRRPQPWPDPRRDRTRDQTWRMELPSALRRHHLPHHHGRRRCCSPARRATDVAQPTMSRRTAATTPDKSTPLPVGPTPLAYRRRRSRRRTCKGPARLFCAGRSERKRIVANAEELLLVCRYHRIEPATLATRW